MNNLKNKFTLALTTLGCDKNRVDSEMLLHQFQKHGFVLVDDHSKADVIVVNTCAFLESARKEAIETILELSQFRQTGSLKTLVVAGCLSQQFGEEVFPLMTEADVVVGINEYKNIAQIVLDALKTQSRVLKVSPCTKEIFFDDRILTTPKHYAYLKIADGCNNFCSYCLIPYIRGRNRSTPIEQLVGQATKLLAQGVSELILVAQDTTKYGVDLYGKPKLVELLQELSKLDLKRIRLLYCYPELVDDKLLHEIENNPKICKYVDIPLQHICDKILKSMNRKTNKQSIISLFDKIASLSEKVAVRTTFICGFPGETEKTFEEVVDFLKKYKLENVGAFAYSKEEGTLAYKMKGHLLKRDKEKFVKRLYKVQNQIVKENNLNYVGKIFECVIDEQIDQNTYVARSQYQAPEIDSVVYVTSLEKLDIGGYYNVKICSIYDDYDLVGEIA